MKHEDKALKDIMQGKTPEKKIQVAGYDKEWAEKVKKEKEEERKANESYSKMMASLRMPLFCPECQSVMNKRIDKKFWNMMSKCHNCVVQEEHKVRLQGEEAWKEYENKKVKANALSWLKDQEVQFEEWKVLVMQGGESIISDEKGTQEKWVQSQKEAKELVSKMQKEFDNMKKELLEEINSN
tara:strand:+ start:570 stop:1118 length:549 start_codon:yes stop_codon:yes gene_type:complete